MRVKRNTNKRPFPLHPFLFAVYPILYLYARNLQEATLVDLARPAVVAVVAAGVLLLLARAVFKDAVKSAILVSIVMIMVFTYGYALQPIARLVIAGFPVGRGIYVLPTWTLLFLVVLFLVARSRRNLQGASQFANVLSTVLVAISVIQIVAYHLQPSHRMGGQWSDYVDRCTQGEHALRPEPGKPLRDIYYIILDEYARDDVLAMCFGHDNRGLTGRLKDEGFYVASESVCNYGDTYLSLSSSLNFGYLQRMSKAAGIGNVNISVLGSMIHDSKVARLLKDAGYKFVFFPSDYHVTSRSPNADLLMRRSELNLSEFDRVLVNTTIFKPFNPAYRCYAANILHAFDELPKVAQIDEPTFMFAHITLPHSPYLFDADGNELSKDTVVQAWLNQDHYEKLYPGQLAYASKRMRAIVGRILSESKTEPIIIIQADHGLKVVPTGLEAHAVEIKSGILNAYYLPAGGDRLLYPGISPVNSFRIIFNHYFGADFELLDDTTYTHEPTRNGYRFSPVSR